MRDLVIIASVASTLLALAALALAAWHHCRLEWHRHNPGHNPEGPR